MIKAVIFDLDNTLLDFMKMKEVAVKSAIKGMIEAGLEIDEVDHMGSVEAGSTKAEIRRALKKNTKGKLQNRILLNAFIEKVA